MKQKVLWLGLLIMALATINIPLLPAIFIVFTLYQIFMWTPEVIVQTDRSRDAAIYQQGIRDALAAENSAQLKLYFKEFDAKTYLCTRHTHNNRYIYTPVYEIGHKRLKEIEHDRNTYYRIVDQSADWTQRERDI